jgi:type IV pilus biogenesis protein CpaD/CtpE
MEAMNSRREKVWHYSGKALVVFVFAALLLSGCANPADDKPKAAGAPPRQTRLRHSCRRRPKGSVARII